MFNLIIRSIIRQDRNPRFSPTTDYLTSLIIEEIKFSAMTSDGLFKKNVEMFLRISHSSLF